MWRKIITYFQTVRRNWLDFPRRHGTIVGRRYQLQRFIGQGSYGQTYLATDLHTDEQYVVKLNNPSKRQTAITLLRRESDLMQRLHHPQIPRWYDYIEEGKTAVLVMERIEGTTLEAMVVEQNAIFSEEQVIAILRQLGEPLAYLHTTGYVHRDVRIPNVMKQHKSGHYVLIDFGLACKIGEVLPAQLTVALGENFSSLEAGERRDSWHDVKRRTRQSDVGSDIAGLAHFALFLLYTSFTPPDDGVERNWKEELHLSTSFTQWLACALGETDTPFASITQCMAALPQMSRE